MPRIFADYSELYEAKAKLPKPDGEHCVICGGDLPKFKRKYCSDKCYFDWKEQFNIKNWNWTRRRVLRRDKDTCQDCGEKVCGWTIENHLEVHHISPIQDGGDEFDEDNCITLCVKCHKERHRILRTKTPMF